ncbi:substrate-binding domain-containing protein [Aquimarina latercula]|uniref:substrate-binding domain-containing protein n=1 Tax=Aquimarina latercula TaxID=987 RepID=UPI0009D6B549
MSTSDKGFRKHNFEKIIKRALDEDNIDAIIAADEISGIKILQTINTTKYRIPDDIAVINFNNGLFLSYMTSSLSTVDQQTLEMVGKALKI